MPLKGKSRSKKVSRKQKQQQEQYRSASMDDRKNEKVRVVATTTCNQPSVSPETSNLWGQRWTLNISFPTLMDSNKILEPRSPSANLASGIQGRGQNGQKNHDGHASSNSSAPEVDNNALFFNTGEKTPPRPRISLKVLPKIFHLLPLQDLKSCRVVNSTWNKIASDELIARHDSPVSFDFCLEAKHYYCKSLSDEVEQNCREFRMLCSDSACLNSISSTKVTLRDLINCLRSSSLSTNFPWTYFEFTDGIIDRCPDARDFFSVYGSRIQRLTINFSRVTLPNLHKLFFYMAPNVEHLKLDKLVCIGAQAEAYQLNPISITSTKYECQNTRQSKFCQSLPSLKILELGSDGRMIAVDWILRAVVGAAINLQEIRNASLDHLDVIVQSNKVHCVKTFYLHLNLSLFKYEWILQKFVNFHLNLRRLVFTVDQKWRGERQAKAGPYDALIPMMFPKVINKMLRSCPETLETLTLMPLGNFSALEFPVMGKLRRLTLQAYNFVAKCEKGHWMNQLYFPEWLDFTKIFPNLRELSVTLISWELNFRRDYGKLSCIPSVQSLTVSSYSDSISRIIPIFAHLFPNVKYLTLKFDARKLNGGIMALIWKFWPHLTELRFELVGTTQSLYFGEPLLDLVFTGLDKKSYEIVKNNPFGSFLCSQNLIRRVCPSISDMLELKKLSVNFSRYFDDDNDCLRDAVCSRIAPPLSVIAALYDINWLPHLDVKLSFDEYPSECRGLVDALQPIAPYVAIEFNQDYVREIEMSPTHCTFCEVAEANHQWFEAHGLE